ncbi:MAG: chemotaxis protein CheW [Thermodesulfobacteriota bacterium]
MNARDRTARAAAEPERLVQMISFTLGAERFGVEILDVQEIIMMSSVTEIPNSPDFVEGVINLRGNIIPVLDLRKRLRMRKLRPQEERAPGTRILVVEIDGNVTGFIVDSVAKVLSVPAQKINPPPDIIVAGVQSQYIGGVVHLDEGIMVILDFRKILSGEEKAALGTVSRMLPALSEDSTP